MPKQGGGGGIYAYPTKWQTTMNLKPKVYLKYLMRSVTSIFSLCHCPSYKLRSHCLTKLLTVIKNTKPPKNWIVHGFLHTSINATYEGKNWLKFLQNHSTMKLMVKETGSSCMAEESSTTGVCRGIPIFLIFAPKHRLWVLVRTASARRF